MTNSLIKNNQVCLGGENSKINYSNKKELEIFFYKLRDATERINTNLVHSKQNLLDLKNNAEAVKSANMGLKLRLDIKKKERLKSIKEALVIYLKNIESKKKDLEQLNEKKMNLEQDLKTQKDLLIELMKTLSKFELNFAKQADLIIDNYKEKDFLLSDNNLGDSLGIRKLHDLKKILIHSLDKVLKQKSS